MRIPVSSLHRFSSLDSSLPVSLQYGDTPLHYACFCGHTEVAKLLVARGADPNKPSRDGKTPLESAQEEGHLQLVVTVAPESTVGKAAAAAIASGKPASGTPITAAAGAAGAPGSYVAPAAPSLGPPGAGALPGGSSSSGAAGGGGGGGGPPRMIGGLDFSRGVILEGELRKKRANKLMKWRNKYYVLSRTYAALFFWTGTRDRVGECMLFPHCASTSSLLFSSPLFQLAASRLLFLCLCASM